MNRIWSRPVGVSDPDGLDYWDFFASGLIERATIFPGACILDVGCGTGTSLFPAAALAGSDGHAIGIDLCPG